MELPLLRQLYNVCKSVFIYFHHKYLNKMKNKNKEYYTAGTVLKYNRKIVERGKIDTFNIQIHDHSLS